MSFLIDSNRIIRLVHPGGMYVKGDPDITRIEAEIEQLLREKKKDMTNWEQP